MFLKVAEVSLSSDCDRSDAVELAIVQPRQNTRAPAPSNTPSKSDCAQEKAPPKRKKTAKFKKNPKAPKRFRR